MPRTALAAALAAALLLAAPTARAQGLGLRHLASVYQDDKEGPLRSPEGVACDEAGTILVADTGNARLLRYGWKDGALEGGAPVRLPQISYPTRVQIDSRGHALVLDRKAKRIVRVDAGGGFAGALEVKGLRGAAAVVPGAFKLDGSDHVFILDLAERRVVETDPGGTAVRELPVPRGATFTDVAPGPGGKLYAVDPVAASVWVAERGATAFRELARGLKDRVSFPAYLAVQGGRIFLADQHGNGIASLGVDGSPQGRELAYGFADGQLQYPGQICATAHGEIVVADRGNSRIQIFAVTR